MTNVRCSWLDPQGKRCKELVTFEYVIHQDPEVRADNDSWFIVHLCDTHKQDKQDLYSEIIEDYEVDTS